MDDLGIFAFLVKRAEQIADDDPKRRQAVIDIFDHLLENMHLMTMGNISRVASVKLKECHQTGWRGAQEYYYKLFGSHIDAEVDILWS